MACLLYWETLQGGAQEEDRIAGPCDASPRPLPLPLPGPGT